VSDDAFLAIVNPAAGGGRCGKLAKAELERLRAAGIELEVAETSGLGDATRLARLAYAQGRRNFIAVGGDGTAYEIVNGIFPEADAAGKPVLGFLPLGTGNSFLRDFTSNGVEYAREAILAHKRRSCDVFCLKHSGGQLYFINLLSMGFTADVTAAANRSFKGLGELGYLLGVLQCLAHLRRRPFPLRAQGDAEFDRKRCLFLSFNNSRFTGGKMMIAPQACTSDGLIEYVRWGPIGRIGLLWNLPGLFDGTHIHHSMASRREARRIEFELDAPVDVMIDGEVLTVKCESVEVLAGVLDVVV
jgi:YegS/Rv2252/BmrU family lipid kinase